MLAAVLIIVGLGAALIALAVQKRFRRVRAVAGGLILTYVVIVLALGGAELYLRYIYADSRMEFALYGGNWAKRYVQKNTLGYRDREWTVDELADHKTIFAIGDSFTEGWGLNDPALRYTDVLASLLGDQWAVVNIARAGAATLWQAENFENHPYQSPDVVIWQYFLNDIEIAAKSNGMEWRYELPPIPQIAEESYLASFLYWRSYGEKLYTNVVDGRSEWEFYYAAYDNAYIWEIHQQEIDRLIETIESRGARIIVVIFPEMVDPVKSVAYVDRVAQFFESRGVTDILKLYDQAAEWPLEARIVSRFDSHASASFNAMIGQTLYERFFADVAATDDGA